MTKIAIVYYSLYGHVATMAESIKKGIEAGGAECDIFQVAETLPTEVLEKMSAPPKKEHPVIENPTKLTEYDGIMFGISGRYGSYSAQVKVRECGCAELWLYGVVFDCFLLILMDCSSSPHTHMHSFFLDNKTQAFMDSTGSLWSKGALTGKAGGVFQSTATQGGGQETIGLTIVPFFVHHGMVFVPLGYTEPKMFSFDEPHGSTPYGAGCFAGPDGSRMPSDLEKEIAESHGKHFATITAKLASP